MASSETDEETAASWAVRLDGGPLEAVDQEALDQWLAADERRAGALLRAEAALAYLDRGRALGAGEEHESKARPARFWKPLVATGSLAATIALAFLLVPASPADRIEIATAIGEIRRVPLADGSVASVNTDSDVEIEMSDDQRRISLKHGEAWFQVAHDRTRPFLVEAGTVRVQAVGTAFSVRRTASGAEILVTEGVVEAWSQGGDGRVRISAGNRGFVPEGSVGVKVTPAPGGIDRALAWRTGELALDGESLGFAAGELNRYNRRAIVIDNPALGREPLVGYFRVDQPEAFARAVASTLGARVRVEGEAIHLDR
ncbi:FecR family protein [Sphingomonas colocasiae]|uniref:FecR domain-containing protein n=1 Tax=Sphingomonas colocasiae TaxID=1848973 RepID=A0ABS7PPW7_9SPHN|nr:FecR domain-containing protein [Sphingomonas colocasiae]MBY8823358.1 FecR domain-containing protein [Sphingomonas colocasiae]